MSYGGIEIVKTDQEHYADFTIRTFSMCYVSEARSRGWRAATGHSPQLSKITVLRNSMDVCDVIVDAINHGCLSSV